MGVPAGTTWTIRCRNKSGKYRLAPEVSLNGGLHRTKSTSIHSGLSKKSLSLLISKEITFRFFHGFVNALSPADGSRMVFTS